MRGGTLNETYRFGVRGTSIHHQNSLAALRCVGGEWEWNWSGVEWSEVKCYISLPGDVAAKSIGEGSAEVKL